MSEFTQLLESLAAGDEPAAEKLLPIVYDELRRLAAKQMATQPEGHTLQATALVHEAYLRMAGTEKPSWRNRAHFFRVAAEAMRQVLIDNARKKARLKRGGAARERVDLQSLNLASEANDETLLVVHEALDRLEKSDSTKAELVKLRFFVGLNNKESANVLELSEAAVKRHWDYIRAWLFREISRLRESA